MNRGRSAAIASIAELVLYIVAYAWHTAAAGTFALPPSVLVVMLPATPVIDYVLSYVIHGLSTGEWTPPLPLKPTGELKPKPPVPVPPVPPAVGA